MSRKNLTEQVAESWASLPPEQQARYKTLGATIAAVSTTAILGSAATNADSRWYRALDKPWFQPPKWLFPVVWTALYADIAAVTGLTLADLEQEGRKDEFDQLKATLASNLALNVGWSVLFFALKRPLLSTIEAAALAYSSAKLAKRVGRVAPSRGTALLPYAVWTGFATVLTFTLWRRNRRVKAKDHKDSVS